MAAQFDSWESYFYPETYDPAIGGGVLRNIPGIREFDALRAYDYRLSFARRTELELRPELVARTFDGEHMKALHGRLFGDVYEWAGQYRTVNMSKGGAGPFADAQNGAIDAYLTDVQGRVIQTDWQRLDRPTFAERAAEVFARVNQAHPFREGNGRTAKLFMEHVAERSQFTFEFERVPTDVWNYASALSRPPKFVYAPDHTPLIPVFEHAAVPRSNLLIHEGGRVTDTPAQPPSVADRIENKLAELREGRSASKPKPSTERNAAPKPDDDRPPRAGGRGSR